MVEEQGFCEFLELERTIARPIVGRSLVLGQKSSNVLVL